MLRSPSSLDIENSTDSDVEKTFASKLLDIAWCALF